MAIGQRLLRVEDRPLLTGQGRFLDDIVESDALEVAFVRSPVAHGLLRGTDRSEALAIEGVEGIYTAEDLGLEPIVSPSTNPAVNNPPQPPLAVGKVRFVGELIAVVVAKSRYIAEDAAQAVVADIEPLETLTSVERALEADAPEIHPGASNAVVNFERDEGEVDKAFAAADKVIERTFRTPRHSAMPIEPRAVLAFPDGDGVHVRSSSQAPHKTRQLVAEMLGLDMEKVRVSVPDVGGGFGVKAHQPPEEVIVAALALRLGRPVKWVEDRLENLSAAYQARNQLHRIRVAATAEGKVLALDCEMLCDQGAYGAYPHGVSLEAATTSGLLPGPYTIRNYRLKCKAVVTNKSPTGAYRGVGFSVAVYVHERLMDILAAELGIDRLEIRRRNLIPADQFPYASVAGPVYDNGEYVRALDLAAEMIGYERVEEAKREAAERGLLAGLGISTYVEPTGMNSAIFKARGQVGIAGFDSAHVEIDAAGQATVWTTTPTIGQGTDTTMAQIAADFLGFELADVTVARSDTAVSDMHGTGTFASRSAVASGGAIKGACITLRERLIEDAAEHFEAAPGDIEIVGGEARVVGTPARAVKVSELVAAAAPERFQVSDEYDPPATAYPYATHACLVTVDPDTGQVVIEKYAVAEDCGTLINPIITEGQVVGAIAQGIGGALYEGHDYDEEGQLRTSSLMDYLVPTANEIPEIHTEHLEIPSPTTWNGVKGVGEGGTIGSAPAVANAVCNAVGAELNQIPVTPEQVLAALAQSPDRPSPA